MPAIEIHEADFSRLQRIAVPLVDTPASVFSRLLDFYESIDKASEPVQLLPLPRSDVFGAQAIPPMVHTKLLSAKFGDIEPDKATWDSLVRLALIMTHESNGKSVPDLRRQAGDVA